MPKKNFSELAADIRERPCSQPLRLVAVDGGAGAGKTTFAAHLARAVGAPVVQMDDFISLDDLEHWWARLETEVLAPLFQGKGCRYQIRDWVGDLHGRGLLQEWKELSPGPFVILEGVGASRRALGERLHYSVWIDAPAPLRIQRGLERDAEVEGSLEIWATWMPKEAAFHLQDGARSRADLRVDGSVPYEGEDLCFEMIE